MTSGVGSLEKERGTIGEALTDRVEETIADQNIGSGGVEECRLVDVKVTGAVVGVGNPYIAVDEYAVANEPVKGVPILNTPCYTRL